MRQGGRSCVKAQPEENFQPPHTLFCRNIKICRNLRVLGNFGQEVHYYGVNIAYYTELDVTFPNVGKVFYLSTHKLLVAELS